MRAADVTAVLTGTLSAAEAQNWQNYVAPLPVDMTLEELRDWLWADSDEQQMTNNDAISRLQRHDEYLVSRIAKRESEGQPVFHQQLDREAVAFGIAALRYVIEVEEYEASQK